MTPKLGDQTPTPREITEWCHRPWPGNPEGVSMG